MLILDLLLRIEALETNYEREAFAEGLYKTNRKFAELCDLAYRRSMVSRYIDGQPFPEYKQDNVGYGLHLSQIEKVINKLELAGFVKLGAKPRLTDKVADNKLVQIFESLSDVENRFVQYVLRKEIPWFDREAWKRAKHT